MSTPFSPEAETSVIGQMLAKPKCIGEVSATLLAPEHFYVGAHRLLYAEVVERFFRDEPLDPLTVAEACAKKLSSSWGCTEAEAIERVKVIASTFATGTAVDHAEIVKRHADLRALLVLSDTIRAEVERESMPPDQIAGIVGSEAMKIATSAGVRDEIVHFADAGRTFIREMQRKMAMRQAGYEVGVRFGVGAIDAFTHGVQPSELVIAGGEPGVGKSGVWWALAMKYAEGQMKRPEPDRMATLILSLEMGELPSSTRWAQALTGLDSAHMRDGALNQAELRKIVQEWGKKKDYPLYLNYRSGLRLSQLRAIISEAVRKYNVGFVVIDHFLLLYPDAPLDANEADNERVRFLKNAIAKDLDVAVVCLAHTRKAIERADKRPRLSDLRGSGMIAAFADFVPLMFRPYMYASEKDVNAGTVMPTDAELLWVKNRHGIDGAGNFYFDAAKMAVL